MNCCESKVQMSAYLDGELTAAEQEKMEAHLASCESCRLDLTKLQRLANGVAALPSASVPPGFLADVRRKLDSVGAAPQRSWTDRRFRLWWVRLPVGAVAATAVVVWVVMLTRPPAPLSPSAKLDEPRVVSIQAEMAPEPAPVTTMSERARGASPVPGNAPEWVVGDRLNAKEEQIKSGMGSARNEEVAKGSQPALRRDEIGLEKSKLTAAKDAGIRPVPERILVVNRDVVAVQTVAEKVAAGLSGATSRVYHAPDGSMSFLHVEIPASQLAEFRAQFGQQYASMAERQKESLPFRSTGWTQRSLSDSPVGATGSPAGSAYLREAAEGKARVGSAAATNESMDLPFSIGGRGFTGTVGPVNGQESTARKAGVPMVVLEIQIKPQP